MHLQVPRTRPLPEGGTIYQQPRLRPLPVLQSCKSISCVVLFERIGWKGNCWDGWDGDGEGQGWPVGWNWVGPEYTVVQRRKSKSGNRWWFCDSVLLWVWASKDPFWIGWVFFLRGLELGEVIWVDLMYRVWVFFSSQSRPLSSILDDLHFHMTYCGVLISGIMLL